MLQLRAKTLVARRPQPRVPSDSERLESERRRVEEGVVAANGLLAIGCREFVDGIVPYLFGAVSYHKGYCAELSGQNYFIREWHGEQLDPHVVPQILHVDNAGYYAGCPGSTLRNHSLTALPTPLGDAYPVRELNELRKIYRQES